MEIKVKKQVEETLQVETPAYYKSKFGLEFSSINEAGQFISLRLNSVYVWDEKMGSHYKQAIEEMITDGTPCTREEFQAAYRATLERIQAAVDGVEETVNA